MVTGEVTDPLPSSKMVPNTVSCSLVSIIKIPYLLSIVTLTPGIPKYSLDLLRQDQTGTVPGRG
jgi:hypothetical protein